MSRFTTNLAVALLAALALVIPASAREEWREEFQGNRQRHDGWLVNPATIGATAQARHVRREGGRFQSHAFAQRQSGRRGSLQWKDEKGKAKYSAIVTDGEGNQVKEVHFNGKMRYVELSSSSFVAVSS